MPLVIIIIAIMLLSPHSIYADWQDTLESTFDYAESFDQLADWKCTREGNVVKDDYPNDFPVRSDGDPLSNHPNAITWNFYHMGEADNPTFPLSENAIADHGAANVFGGTGKSLIIDYGEEGIVSHKGPAEFAFKIGDSPDDGYPSSCYIFWMQKIPNTFFRWLEAEEKWHCVGYMKNFFVSAGFKSPRRWGTDSEYAYISSVECPIQPHNQTAYEYGPNGIIMNYHPRSGLISDIISVHYTDQDEPNKWCQYTYPDPIPQQNNDTSGVDLEIQNSRWFGVECKFVKSSPPGSVQVGGWQVKIFNSDGEQVTNGFASYDYITFANGATTFNHGINKFQWGENRNGTCDGPLEGFLNTTQYMYYDDIIIDSDPIATSYFALRQGGATAQRKTVGVGRAVNIGGANIDIQ